MKVHFSLFEIGRAFTFSYRILPPPPTTPSLLPEYSNKISLCWDFRPCAYIFQFKCDALLIHSVLYHSDCIFFANCWMECLIWDFAQRGNFIVYSGGNKALNFDMFTISPAPESSKISVISASGERFCRWLKEIKTKKSAYALEIMERWTKGTRANILRAVKKAKPIHVLFKFYTSFVLQFPFLIARWMVRCYHN